MSKSSPRNHLYRTGHPLIEDGPILFAFSQADLDHLGNLADDLHFETALDGRDDDAFEEATQDLNGLIPDFRVFECLLQLLNFSSIDMR